MSFVSRLAGAPEEPVIDAIARNLEAVLNAKQGYAGAVDVFGIGGYEGRLGDKSILEMLSADMIATVRRHEPRLREPKLTLEGKDRSLWLRFSLRGRVDQETRTFAVLYHSILRNVRVALEKPQ